MWVRRLAAAAALLTLCLIVAGGLVTNTDSGLACPDWPLCYGSPLPRMVGGVAVEHTHRLIATSVGICAVGLCFGLLPRRRTMLLCGAILPVLFAGAFAGAWLRQRDGEFPAWAIFLVAFGFAGFAAVAARERGPGRLATVALALVVAQGLLGGLTVVYRLPPTVLVLHTATSMLFLASLVVLAWRLSGRPGTWTATPLAWITAVAVYVQIVLGAAVRHTGAGLVCVDLPYCRGALWPAGVHPSVHLHMAHRAFAFIVLGLVLANAAAMWGARGTIRALALAGPLLVLAQIVLGVLTIVTFKDLVPVTAHLLVAALLLADLVSILALSKPRPEHVAEEAPALGAAT
ncbi:MAG: COX15/CtaA family protein [Myxococcales bacterium]